MAQNGESLTNAFSATGLGVDETCLVLHLGKSNPEQRKSFRKTSTQLFTEDERSFQRWKDDGFELIRQELARFKNAVVLCAMHPWERDARLIKNALRNDPKSYSVIVEIACTRSSGELLGARKAYHSLFDQSIEEDVSNCINGSERQLLVALVSAYRYEGPKIKEDLTKTDDETLADALKHGDKKTLVGNQEVIKILATRSKPHLQALYKNYKGESGKSISEDLAEADLILKQTVECLCTPIAYFCKVVDEAMRDGADANTKEGLTRVIVSQADVNMKGIQEEYNKLFGGPLSSKIEQKAKGNYKNFLLSLAKK